MTPEHTIVRAGPGEQEGVLDLVREYYEFEGIAFDDASIRAGLRTLLALHSLGGAWLVREGTSVAGFFILTFGFELERGGRQATVTELYLRPAFRRRGLGPAALAFIEAFLTSEGIGTFALQVGRNNVEAIAFYAHQGFEALDRLPLSKRLPPR